MPDRYANGDPSNDRGGRTGSRSVTGFDPADTGWYHGGDLKGLTGGCTDPVHGLQRIKDLGFTAIWVTPVVGQQAVQGSSAAYHGYWGRRLHRRRQAPRERRGLQGLHRLRPSARAEGDPRRGRQPHRGRDPRRLRLHRAGRAAVPRLPRQGLCRLALRGRAHVPVPVREEHASPGDAHRRRPHREEAGVAERRHGVPRPRRHRLLVVQRNVLRAGRLLRPRRSLHRAAAGRERARAGLRRLDPALRHRRLPRRHREARRPRLLRRLAAEDPRRRARSRDRRLRGLRRGLRDGRDRALRLRAGPGAAERDRLPAAGLARPFRRRLRRRARRRDAASRTTTTSAAPRGLHRRPRRSSAITTRAGAHA